MDYLINGRGCIRDVSGLLRTAHKLHMHASTRPEDEGNPPLWLRTAPRARSDRRLRVRDPSQHGSRARKPNAKIRSALQEH
ncbi:hypothetical protein SKAU_G00115810 [Synaphobranchus kaupii]|uniref:Uncharacterized protein n=1 Tax=Synaphobranchus kaupii TaxID=118154 RepID=A0A9Q1J1Z7_SYNKA|nr:hypothetical protein SKAU_G00115810 [Synaphobranchus kaupii]